VADSVRLYAAGLRRTVSGSGNDFTNIFVHGSFHADQRAAIQALAAALDATAFDIQTGLALPSP
jgi:hypothetical protein